MRFSEIVKLFLTILIAGGSSWLSAQQTPQHTQFMFNKYQFNPAYGGLDRSLSITAGLRTQWNQFEGAPRTQFINVHLPLYAISGSTGIAVENDQIGPMRRLNISGSYNYIFESVVGLMSFGGRLGVNQISIDGAILRTPRGTYLDNTIFHNDPILLSADMNGINTWWGLGFYVVNDYGEFGLSLDNIPSNGFSAGESRFNSSQLMNVYVRSDFSISELLQVLPSLLIRSDFVQTQTELGAIVYYDNVLGGATIRGYNSNSIDALNIIGGIQLNDNVRLSYSFDLGLSGIRTFHEGTHEFMINYNLNKKIRTGEYPPIIYNPRYQ